MTNTEFLECIAQLNKIHGMRKVHTALKTFAHARAAGADTKTAYIKAALILGKDEAEAAQEADAFIAEEAAPELLPPAR